MQVQRTIKRCEGVWGIVKGDKGGASQVAPLSPLTKLTTFGIAKRCFADAQHDKIPIVIARRQPKQSTVYKARIMRIPYLLIATLALLARNDNWNLVMLSEAKHLS